MQDAFLNHAEAFLLGALDRDEERQFVEHLTSGCVECKQAVTETARVMRALPFAFLPAGSHAAISPGLKERLLDSVKRDSTKSSPSENFSSSTRDRHTKAPLDMDSSAGFQVWKTWSDSLAGAAPVGAAAQQPNLLMVRANEGDWQDIGINGILAKQLFVDPARDAVTMLVRMPAGASYPRHRHAAAEQCYVLEGDLHVGDIILRPGDYQCATAESIHEVQYTEGGCLLLIVSSQHDEII
jgi:quercetin dioxygenase-like cupin family protein